MGTVDDELTVGGAAHLFWRDPGSALLGVYGEIGHTDATGGGTVTRLAVEGEAYWDRLSISLLAGGQFGDLGEGFFSKETLSYYPTDDLKLFVEHNYLPDGVGHSGVFGGEWLVSAASSSISFFGEGQVHEDDDWSANFGARVYFGPQKSLIRRHREDDPGDHFDLLTEAAAAGTGDESAGE